MTGSYLVEAKYRMENLGFEPTEFGHLRGCPPASVLPSKKRWDVNHRTWGSQLANWPRCSAQIGAVSKLEQPATPAFKV